MRRRAEHLAKTPASRPATHGLALSMQLEARAFAEGVRQRKLDAELATRRRVPATSEVLRVVTKETFTFDLGVGGDWLNFPLTDVISSVGYRTCVLQVRVHEIVAIQGTCRARVYVQAASRDVRDPTELLVQKGWYAFCSVDSGTPAPGLLLDGSAGELPESFQVAMEWRPTSAGVSTFTIGVDLVLRK